MNMKHKLGACFIITVLFAHSFFLQTTSIGRAAGVDYLIVYGSSVRAISQLENFASYKESLGYVTAVVSAVQAARDSSGSDQAEKLRNYFKKMHQDQGLKYVLLVGNPFVSGQRDRKSTGGSVPMRYCYPFPNEHSNTHLTAEDIYRIPTDTYYADLTGDWDSDGDGYYGEFKEDRVNLVPEIYIGRIPFDDTSSIEAILTKSMEFENKSSASKKKALLMAGNNSSKENYSDNAVLTELMWRDLFSKKGFTRTTLYEKAGLRRSEYDSTFPLNETEALKQINAGQFGLTYIISNGGNIDSLMRYVWTRDKNFNDKPDPDECEWLPIVTADKAQRFSKENPSIYFITGYMPMAPDGEKESIGKILLNTKAVAVMGETRLGYWYSHWKNQRDGGMHSIIYYFTQAMLDGKSTGEALYHSFAYASEHDYYNAYSYGVLYGDPSLSLEEKKRAETKPPGPPVNLRGSLSGNTVRLTWSPSDKGTYSIDGYTIFRGTDANVLSYVTNVSSSTLQWEDKSVQAGNTYYYYVKAFDIRKNFSAESNKVSVIYKSQPGDTKPPSIVVFEPANNSQTTQSVINVIGQVTDDDSGVSLVTLDQKRISYDQQGNFNEKVSLKEGLNLIEIQAEDRSGNKSELTLRITRINEEKKDTTPPSIRIFYPKNGDTFSSESVEINGRIWDEDSGIDRASMNTKPLVLSKDGTFAASVLLKSGTNSILFEAWDKAGNYASEEFFLIRTDETIIKLTIGNTTAFVNGKAVPLDVPPTIIAGRTMVPIRFISEAFGAEVQWESETRTVRIYFEKTQTRVTLQINNTIARINDKIVTLDAPPQILNGRTMVPIRFISEAFGASVDWDNATRTVTITLSI